MSEAMSSDMYKYAPYKDAMVKYIMNYHRGHTNSLRLAVVVSTGPEVGFAAPLAAYFSHVHLHLTGDIMPARRMLSRYHSNHWEQGRFTLSTGRLESVQYGLASRSVDMVLFDDCAHLAGVSDLTEAAEEMLTPNGCVVFTRYLFGDFPHLKLHGLSLHGDWLSKEAASAYAKLVSECQMRESDEESSRPVPEAYAALLARSGLDFIELDPEFFYENVTKRVGINDTPIGREMVMSKLRLPEYSPTHYTANVLGLESKEREQERLVVLDDISVESLFREEIKENELKTYFKRHLTQDDSADVRKLLQELRKQIPHGSLQACFRVRLVLGTRNMKYDWESGRS